MVKRVIWTPELRMRGKKFLNIGSEELNQKPTDIDNVRIKIVRDYLIFYELVEDELHILAFWDSRQNPEKLKLK